MVIAIFPIVGIAKAIEKSGHRRDRLIGVGLITVVIVMVIFMAVCVIIIMAMPVMNIIGRMIIFMHVVIGILLIIITVIPVLGVVIFVVKKVYIRVISLSKCVRIAVFISPIWLKPVVGGPNRVKSGIPHDRPA